MEDLEISSQFIFNLIIFNKDMTTRGHFKKQICFILDYFLTCLKQTPFNKL